MFGTEKDHQEAADRRRILETATRLMPVFLERLFKANDGDEFPGARLLAAVGFRGAARGAIEAAHELLDAVEELDVTREHGEKAPREPDDVGVGFVASDSSVVIGHPAPAEEQRVSVRGPFTGDEGIAIQSLVLCSLCYCGTCAGKRTVADHLAREKASQEELGEQERRAGGSR